jgi:hypothetical protein
MGCFFISYSVELIEILYFMKKIWISKLKQIKLNILNMIKSLKNSSQININDSNNSKFNL